MVFTIHWLLWGLPDLSYDSDAMFFVDSWQAIIICFKLPIPATVIINEHPPTQRLSFTT